MSALLFLSEYCKREGMLDDAEAYATQLLDYSGDATESAKATLREVAALRSQGGAAADSSMAF